MHTITNTYDGLHRILVVANETSSGSELHDMVSERSRRGLARQTEVLVVAPTLNSRLRHLFSDIDSAVREAELRLCECVDRLRVRGVDATGLVGDADPLQAIEDLLRTFPADELIISTHAPEHSHWLAHDIVARARGRFELPTSHITVHKRARAVRVPAAA
ncbi:MAG: hypothetical protein HYX29_01110 [Solirubrobacterales bacterium]|nr:hypothetical protein [Solirubrobacterales bacterium]